MTLQTTQPTCACRRCRDDIESMGSTDRLSVLRSFEVDKSWAWRRRTIHRLGTCLLVRASRELSTAVLELAGPTEFRAAWGIVSSVGGFSTDRAESLALYCSAKNGPGDGAIVEVGSYLGRSACFLALGSKLANREHVISIDPHRGSTGHPGTDDPSGGVNTLPLFMHNLGRVGVTDWVRPIVADAMTAARGWQFGTIRLLFVDGLHTYEAVKSDIAALAPYLTDQSVVIFDDYYGEAYPGIRAAAEEAYADGLLRGPQQRVNRFAIYGARLASMLCSPSRATEPLGAD